MCRYDERDPTKTIPVILIGKSGEGKTALLENIVAEFPSKIYQKDGITEASLPDMKMTNNLICIDELSKWSIPCLSAVVMLFSHGTTARARKGKQVQIVASGIPVGTLLDTWESTADDVKSVESKRFIIAQLMRRAIVLHVQPTTRDPAIHREYVESVVAKIFGLNRKNNEKIANIRRGVRRLIRKANAIGKDVPDIVGKDHPEFIDYIMSFLGKIEIDPLVSYDEEFCKLVCHLAVGRALANGRKVTALEDVQHVGAIIERHAKELGMWRERTAPEPPEQKH